jgi:D-alanyl-D-alanine dipeptidase
MNLVKITTESFSVEIDLAYAGPNNFTGQPVYGRAACFLHPDAVTKLQRTVALAAAQGLRLRIFDAFRPAEAQWVLWNHTSNPDFLADPRRGSPHSRGVALDLTLIDASGRTLDMGTPFDAFTPLSHHGNLDVTPTAQKNRIILLGLMTAAGWDCYQKEWWHYQLFKSHNYPLLSDNLLVESMMPADSNLSVPNII